MRRVLTMSALALLLSALDATEAQGFFRRRHCESAGPPACETTVAAPQFNIAWVDQVVTRYRTEVQTREVPRQVTRPVSRVETRDVTYDVQVPFWETVKRS